MRSRARRSFRLWALLALLLASPVESSSLEVAGSPAPQLFPCAINRVDGTFATGGFAALTGWAADPGGVPVAKIEIFLDDAIPGEAKWGGFRPDVLAHFARADYLWSGWYGTVALDGVSPGIHTIRAMAVSRTGKYVDCGTREMEVRAVAEPPELPVWKIAGKILFRTAVFLAWLAFVGWALAGYLGCRPVPLSAPVLGLALFALFAEAGSVLFLRPLISAAALTVASTVALAVLWGQHPKRLKPDLRAALPSLAFAVVFAAVGVVPLASHGQGAVLGDIDDAVRECSVADSISEYRWTIPPDARGYLAQIPTLMRARFVRPGGSYLLSALADLFGTRAHEVHSVAMLGVGCLLVLGAGLTGRWILRESPKWSWIAPAFVSVNSTLLGTLYGQHFGSLLAAALIASSLFHVLRLARSRLRGTILPVALLFAAEFTLYPEAMAIWLVAGLLSLTLAASWQSRARTAKRLLLAGALAIGLNPIGVSRAIRFGVATVSESKEMASPYNRLIAGDTHYFPSLNVIAGIEAYREDAPAPVGLPRRVLIPVADGLLFLVVVLGWRRLSGREKALLLFLLTPTALALFSNYLLGFPYGFAKFLPLAVVVWAIAFAFFCSRAIEGAMAHPKRRWRVAVIYSSIGLLALLTLPGARHVVARARRAVPSYDPAFRVLPALAAALDRASVFQIDEPLVARREWMCYFLGGNAVGYEAAQGVVRWDGLPGPRYRLIDRRDQDTPLEAPAVSTRNYAAMLLPDSWI